MLSFEPMSMALFAVALVLLLLAVAVWRHRRGGAAVLVSAEPDAALLSSAAALRRLGARITRYDAEVGTLEATLPDAGVVRVRAVAGGAETTRVHLEGGPGARRVLRRFRGALSA